MKNILVVVSVVPSGLFCAQCRCCQRKTGRRMRSWQSYFLKVTIGKNFVTTWVVSDFRVFHILVRCHTLSAYCLISVRRPVTVLQLNWTSYEHVWNCELVLCTELI